MKLKPKRGQADLRGDGRDYSRLVLAAFDSIEDDAETERLIELNRRCHGCEGGVNELLGHAPDEARKL